MAANLNLMAPQKAWDTKYADDTGAGSVIFTSADQTLNALLNWGRANSIWYMLFGLACCAIELMQTGGPRGDLERFGARVLMTLRTHPRVIVDDMVHDNPFSSEIERFFANAARALLGRT